MCLWGIMHPPYPNAQAIDPEVDDALTGLACSAANTPKWSDPPLCGRHA